jgi:hypothetical protein
VARSLAGRPRVDPASPDGWLKEVAHLERLADQTPPTAVLDANRTLRFAHPGSAPSTSGSIVLALYARGDVHLAQAAADEAGLRMEAVARAYRLLVEQDDEASIAAQAAALVMASMSVSPEVGRHVVRAIVEDTPVAKCVRAWRHGWANAVLAGKGQPLTYASGTPEAEAAAMGRAAFFAKLDRWRSGECVPHRRGSSQPVPRHQGSSHARS